MILKARRGTSPGELVRYLKKRDRSDVMAWCGFDGTYKTLRRDFSQAVDEMYSHKVSPREVASLHTVIVSFHRDELDPKRPEDVEAARLLAQSWMLETYPGRPAMFAVQSDGKGHCLHVHIAVSNVGRDGRCLSKEKSDYRKLTRSFTAHMQSFGMTDILHDEKGNQTYQRSPEDKASRFTDVHEKARSEGLNSWKDCLSIRLDSVLLEKPATQEDFERECEKAGVLIRQPRGEGGKSWTSLKNWGFALAEMDSEAGMEDLRKTGILTDPKTRLHYVTDRGLGGTGRYSREGIMEALGWGGKSSERAEKTEKTVEPKPKPVETGISEPVPLYDLVADVEKQKDTTAPVVTEKPKTETKHEPKQEKGTPMKEDKFDPEEMHRETVESIYSSTQMLMSMNGVGFDEALAQATKNLPDYRTDVRSMYLKEHPEACKPKTKSESAAKPAKRSEQPKQSKPEQKQQQTQYKQQAPKQQTQQQKQQAQQKELTPEELAYEMAHADAMEVLRRGERSFIITMLTWWNLMTAERALIKAKEHGTDEQMDEMRAADEREYQAIKDYGSNKLALEKLAGRTMRDLNRGYREGKKFLKRITTQEIHLTPEQKQMRDELQLNIAKRQQQKTREMGEMEL